MGFTSRISLASATVRKLHITTCTVEIEMDPIEQTRKQKAVSLSIAAHNRKALPCKDSSAVPPGCHTTVWYGCETCDDSYLRLLF